MRCSSFVIIYLLLFSGLYAQLDLVYLADGGIIRGNILAEVPGEGITIDTDEGELLIIKQKDINRIARVKAIEGYWDVIYLKPNSKQEGFITKYQWQESLTLTNMEGENIKLPIGEIKKIERVTVPDDETYRESVRLAGKSRGELKRNRSSGHGLFFVEYGFQMGITEENRMAPGFFLNQILAWKVPDLYSLGLGIGFDWLWFNGGQTSPGRKIYFDGRIFSPRKKTLPYAFLDVGYDWFRNGAFVNPGIGSHFRVFNLFSVNMALGLNLQQVDTDRPGNAGLSSITRMMQLRMVID